MKEQDWTEQLRRRLSDYEEPAPDGLWADIERRVQRRARLVMLRRWVVGVAASILLFVGGWHLTKPLDTALPYMANADASDILMPSTDEVQEEAEASPMIAKVERERTVNTSARSLAKRPSPTQTEVQPAEALDEPAEEPLAMAVEGTRTMEKQPEETAMMRTAERSAKTLTSVDASTPVREYHRLESAREHHHRPKVSLQLHAANLMAYGGSTQVEPMLMTPSYMGNATHELSRVAPVYLSNHEEKAEHHRPLTIGLTLRLPLGGRWWLASGATVARISSTFTQQMNSSILTNRQRLYYVGVPVQAGYSFWQRPRLQAYASLGAEAQCNIKTEVDDGYLGRDRVQFSCFASAGLEYGLLPHLSVYVQPGLRFYPDNGSRVQNIFKEKPWQLDLQLGLRLH